METVKKEILTQTGKTPEQLIAEVGKFAELYESPKTGEKLVELIKKYETPYKELCIVVNNNTLPKLSEWLKKYPFIHSEHMVSADRHSKTPLLIVEAQEYPGMLTVEGERGIPGHVVIEVAELCLKLLKECSTTKVMMNWAVSRKE